MLRTAPGLALLCLLSAGCARKAAVVVATPERAAAQKPRQELVYLAEAEEVEQAARMVLERHGYPVDTPEPGVLLTPRRNDGGERAQQNRRWSRYAAQVQRVAPGRSLVRLFRVEQSEVGETTMESNLKRAHTQGAFREKRGDDEFAPAASIQRGREEHSQERSRKQQEELTEQHLVADGEAALNRVEATFRGTDPGVIEPFELARGRRDLALEAEVTALLEAVPSLELVGGEVPVPLQVLVVDDKLPVSKPLALRCGEALPGADALLRPGATVLVGDPLGTREVPVALAQLACTAAAAGVPVVLGVALPSSEQPMLDAYSKSAGTGADLAKLLTEGTFWRRTFQDGRSSGAVLGLVEHARALKAAGRAVELVALDAPVQQGNAREAHLAERLLAARAAHPGAVLLAALGDVHVRTRAGAPWAEDLVPTGARLVQQGVQPVVLDAAFQRGTQHTCRFTLDGKKVACRVYMRSPTQATLHPSGAPRGVELFTAPRADGMHGRLLLGELTASLPALRVEEAVARSGKPAGEPPVPAGAPPFRAREDLP